ncbi:MAG: dTMP kinase [Gammaproteobacteria bacterium]|nr:dTMP kinase [Gammaproteobacteria bacterium]
MEQGKFITLEGTEGVGKTTNLELICAEIARAGHSVVTTREPGGTPLAEEIRELLLAVREESVSGTTELLLMFAARAQHVSTVIRPALEAGQWVVCDRFTDATYAYQGGGRGLDQDVIHTLENVVQCGLQPDLTIFLDVPVAIAIQRIADRNHDRFEREQVEFFERVRSAYLERAANHERIRIVDASTELEEVQANLRVLLAEFLSEPS